MHTLGFVAATDAEAESIQWPHYQEQFARIGEERGWSPPTYEHFMAEVDHGSMYVGSPEKPSRTASAEVVRTLDLSRFPPALCNPGEFHTSSGWR